MGSADEAYRPEEIFGRSNTYPYQRIFGEIHLKGFSVSHTKDGIKWEESEDEFLRKLRKALSDESFPLLQQAREHRTKSSVKNIRKDAAAALNITATTLQDATLFTCRQNDNVLHINENDFNETFTNDEAPLPDIQHVDKEQAKFIFLFRGEKWLVEMELSYIDDDAEWLTIQNRPLITDPEPRITTVRVAMLHPFMVQFPTMDTESFTALINIAGAMALAEIVAVELGDTKPSAIRRYTNEILKTQMKTRISND